MEYKELIEKENELIKNLHNDGFEIVSASSSDPAFNYIKFKKGKVTRLLTRLPVNFHGESKVLLQITEQKPFPSIALTEIEAYYSEVPFNL